MTCIAVDQLQGLKTPVTNHWFTALTSTIIDLKSYRGSCMKPTCPGPANKSDFLLHLNP